MPFPLVIEPCFEPSTVETGETDTAVVDVNDETPLALVVGLASGRTPRADRGVAAVGVGPHSHALVGTEIGGAQHWPSSSSRMRAKDSRSSRWASIPAPVDWAASSARPSNIANTSPMPPS